MKVDMFKEILPAIGKKDRSFYNNLPVESKKSSTMNFWMIHRWVTCSIENREEYIFLVNEERRENSLDVNKEKRENSFNKEERRDRNSFIIEFLKEIRYRLYSFIILALIFFII